MAQICLHCPILSTVDDRIKTGHTFTALQFVATQEVLVANSETDCRYNLSCFNLLMLVLLLIFTCNRWKEQASVGLVKCQYSSIL